METLRATEGRLILRSNHKLNGVTAKTQPNLQAFATSPQSISFRDFPEINKTAPRLPLPDDQRPKESAPCKKKTENRKKTK